MVLFSRLADELPQVIVRHLRPLLEHATSQDFPHAQVREMAKRAALAVNGALPGALTADELEILAMTNVAQASRFPRGDARHIGGVERPTQQDYSFQFDTMDTVPYWYSPLGRVFGLGAPAVCERAARWITEVWRKTKDDWWSDARELGHFHWGETSNRQGE